MSILRVLVLTILLACSRGAAPCTGGAIGYGKHERDHAEIIHEAKTIVLATVTKENEVELPPWDDLAYFTFSVKEVLKGKAEPSFKMPALRQSVYPGSQTDFSSHKEQSFWETKIGRTVLNDPACQLLPAFAVDSTYLMIDSDRPDSKDFELIESDDDLWLTFVRRTLTSYETHSEEEKNGVAKPNN